MCQYAIYCSDGTGISSVAFVARHDCPLPYSRSILASFLTSSSSNLTYLSSNLAYLTYSRVA
jgi:hypothetical protein